MQNVQQQIQNMPEIKAAATLVATGTGGSIVNAWAELSFFLDIAVKMGNAALIFGGVYLMWCKIKSSKRRDRRDTDKE